MKRLFLSAIMAVMGVCAMAQENTPNTVVVTKTNGETVKYSIEEVKDITFAYEVAAFVQMYAGEPKWANMNVGATAETEYGLYFWWGGTVGHTSDVDNDKYDFSNSNSEITTFGKTNEQLTAAGIIGANGNLTADYDAATVNWGSAYRMPTRAEWKALKDNCTWTWTENYKGSSVNGYLVTGKGDYAKNSIFLPAAGNRYMGSIAEGTHGDYWSATPSSDNVNFAYDLYFNSGLVNPEHYGSRHDGFSVRPVTE